MRADSAFVEADDPVTGLEHYPLELGEDAQAAPFLEAFFDLADAIITVRSLIRQAWTTKRWDGRLHHQP